MAGSAASPAASPAAAPPAAGSPASPPAAGSPAAAHASPPAAAATSPPPLSPLTPRFDQDEDNDADSTLDDDAASSTASIASSIMKYRTVNGRTYHSDRVGSEYYWAPNDDAANGFLEIIYHALTLAIDGKLYLAPLKDDIEKVLDIGTGTGIWAIDYADEHPNTTVIGTDLSPIQPAWVPPNLFFEIENFEQWSFAEKSVDYIHLRYLVGSVRDWTALAKDVLRTLKPGGYVEHYEFDGATHTDDDTVPPDSAMQQWGDIFQKGCDKLGLNVSFNPIREGLIRKALEDAGFVNIVEKPLKIPFSEWPADPRLREIGLYTRAAFERDMRGAVNMPATQLGWSDKEIILYCSQLRKDMRNMKMHGYFNTAVLYAQRPLDS